MPNIGKMFKDEIVRLAKKQVKAELTPMKRDSALMKKQVILLRRQLLALARQSVQLAKQVTPVVAMKETEEAVQKASKLRMTSKRMKRLRMRLGLSQDKFGKLVGVSGQSVVNWEKSAGKLRLRQTTLAALAAIQGIGKREAKRRLVQMGVAVRKRRGGK